jgi:predicted DNA-binding transcriptional regulator YafY
LAEELEVSKRTVYRDKRRRAGIPRFYS